jgi:hypothetical protein
LVPEPGQNLWQWHQSFIADPVVLAGANSDEEGSSYAQHEKTMMQWAPRLFPTGDLQHIGAAARAHHEFLQVNSRDEEPFISNWMALGPFSTPPSAYAVNHTGVGQIHRIVFAPGYGATNTTVYCASGFGGLFKSTDDGTTWQAMTDQSFAFTGVSDLYIEPATGALFVATGASDESLRYSTGVWRSANNGDSWENITQDLYFGPTAQANNIFKLLVSPADPNVQLIATINGIYKTTNALASAELVTWQQVLYPLDQGDEPIENYWKALTFQFGSNEVLFASGKDIYISTDAGETWSSITGAGTGLDFAQAPWNLSAPTANGAALCSRINLVVSSRDANQLHAFVNLGRNGNGSSHAFVLDIANMSWTYRYMVTNDSGSNTSSPSWVAFAASPAGTPETYFYGGRFLKRGAGSTSPSNIGNGTLHDDFQEAVFSPDGTKLWIGTHGGVYRASNPYGPFLTSEWEPLNNQLQVGTIYACSANPVKSVSAFIGNQDCGTSYRVPLQFSSTGDWKHLMGGDGTTNVISPDGVRAWNFLLNPRSYYYRHTVPFTNQPSSYHFNTPENHPNYMGA